MAANRGRMNAISYLEHLLITGYNDPTWLRNLDERTLRPGLGPERIDVGVSLSSQSFPYALRLHLLPLAFRERDATTFHFLQDLSKETPPFPSCVWPSVPGNQNPFGIH